MFFLIINLINEIFRIQTDRNSLAVMHGHQFCTETPSLFLMPLLHLQKNSKCNTKREYFSIKHDLSMILLMSYQNSDAILSKVYCMNTSKCNIIAA